MPDQIQHHAPDGQAVAVVADRPAAPVANLRHVVAMAAGMWLATRLALVAFAYFAVLLGRGGAQHATPVSPAALAPASAQWDAPWDLGIAQAGYFSQQATAFFPLYPLLVRLVGTMIGGHSLAAGLLRSHLGT